MAMGQAGSYLPGGVVLLGVVDEVSQGRQEGALWVGSSEGARRNEGARAEEVRLTGARDAPPALMGTALGVLLLIRPPQDARLRKGTPTCHSAAVLTSHECKEKSRSPAPGTSCTFRSRCCTCLRMQNPALQ